MSHQERGSAGALASRGRFAAALGVAAVTAAAALAIAAAASCGGKRGSGSNPGPGGTGGTDGDLVLVQDKDIPDGLALRLSDGAYEGFKPVRVKPANAQKLSDADAGKLLARLAPIKAKPDDTKNFAMRERSQPPPRTGDTVKGVFPPPVTVAPPGGTAVDPTKGPLRVLRRAPEGDVPLAPKLSVTFSAPMVAVTSHDDTVKSGVPVKLSPTPAGNWRWIGTKTLLFDPDIRFPQATKYDVEIPVGTRATNGATLAEAVRFSFTTPAPRVVSSWPNGGPHKRDPAMFVAFDQKIDPAAVLSTIAVKAGGKRFPIRLLSADELPAHREVKGLVEAAEANEQTGRFIAFRLEDGALLPRDTQIEVAIGPGTPSAEGPLKTAAAQSFSFRTFGPFKVEEARCSYGTRCPPMTPWWVRMSNPIDPEKFEPDTIEISPKLPGRKLTVNGQHLYIHGQSKGRTTYTVTLPSSFTDTFGQTLDNDDELSFRVGSADPSLWGPSGLVVLDPASRKPSFDVFSINHLKLDVKLYRVTPADWPAFAKFMQSPYRRDGRRQVLSTPPGKQVFRQILPIDAKQDEMVETQIDLAPALSQTKAGLRGHVIAIVRPTPWNERWQPPTLIAWVQATKIGLDAFVDDSELIGWATDLATGEPLAGTKLEIRPHGKSATADARGMTTMALPKSNPGGNHMLVATSGGDTAILPENTYWWSDRGGWVGNDTTSALRWYAFDDRKMYRPGETVHIKGWLRRIDFGEGGDIAALAGAVRQLNYRLVGPRGNELKKGKAAVNALGGFDLELELPSTPNLGWAYVHFTPVGKGLTGMHGLAYSHGFQIQEFRRPEFEVSASASQGPHVVGGGADVTVSASYYAGGGLPGAEVSWQVTASPGSFTPPNRDDFTFGTWVPWWGWRPWGQPDANTTTYSQHTGKTDATGRHVLHMDFLSIKPPRPMQVMAQATVMDVNRQAWATSASLLVHPADLYVGVRSTKLFVEKGDPIEIESIAVDHDGGAVPGTRVAMRAVRIDWTWNNGSYQTTEEDEQTCAQPSAAEPTMCTFKTEQGGQYKITARVVDGKGRANESELTVWVSGGDRPAARNVEQEEVQLIPDKKEYRPGESATLLVMSPFYPAEGLLSVRRSGIVSTQRFELDGPTQRVTVPIVDGHTPNVFVQVDVVGSAYRIDDKGNAAPKLPRRPAFAKGQIQLPVPPLHRTLRVQAVPRQRKIEPGGTTTVDVTVRSPDNKPVAGAELAVVVVDESVLSLTGYQHPDPIATFYSQRPAGGRDHHLRQNVKLARPDLDALAAGTDRDADGVLDEVDTYTLEGAAAGDAPRAPEAEPTPDAAAPAEESDDSTRAPSRSSRSRNGRLAGKAKAANIPAGGLPGQQANTPIAVRTNFAALATFAPAVETGADGRASVEVKLPDNLTRYRVVAVAVSDDKYFGKGESSITARMPLMVRPSPPRFLNFGDRFELPIVVQNQTDADMRVQVAVRATNAALTDGMGRSLTVAANDRVEIRFPTAAELPGTARFQIATASGKWADAAELALPVWTPATTEAFATYGELDGNGSVIRQKVAMPGKVWKEFGGLEVTTSSTQLQALTDAFVYLVSYPYECAEQVSSRVIAIAALRDVLTAFETGALPPPAELNAIVARDLTKLKGLQNWDGGFGFWRFGEDSWPYVSIHVANALARAKAKGFAVPAQMLERSKAYLRAVESKFPHWYPIEIRRTLIAYALHVRRLLGDPDPARGRRLISEAGGVDKLSLEAVGWLLGVLTGDRASRAEIAAIHKLLGNRISETSATANFTTSYSDGAYLLLHSSRRADGIILESLIADKPRSDLIPKVVRGLLAHRTRGRWGNTQENAFVLLALDRYFGVFEKVTPNFVSRVWLGDAFAGEHRFRGRTTERHHLDIPMAYLDKIREGDLTIQKAGRGRLYYRIGMTYAPADLELEPADHGFAVERRYEAVDDPGDVTRKKDGTWVVKAGARVRVRLTMVAENRRYHVALVDPLPAGLEPMNPALAVTGAIPKDPNEQSRGPYWWWYRTWYEHQNMRDERVEAFTSLLWEGVHEYTYVARATTPGRFVVPPTKAEEMYFPETFGRSASAMVIVK